MASLPARSAKNPVWEVSGLFCVSGKGRWVMSPLLRLFQVEQDWVVPQRSLLSFVCASGQGHRYPMTDTFSFRVPDNNMLVHPVPLFGNAIIIGKEKPNEENC